MEGDGSPTAKRSKPRRFYQSRWDESYFTTFYNEKIRCVICGATLAEAKESNLKRHHTTHKILFDEWNFSSNDQRRQKYLKLKQVIIPESSSSADNSDSSETPNVAEKLTRASYRITEHIMKHGKPFQDGEIIKKCLLIAAEEVPDVKLFSAISLSRPVVTQRGEDIGEDLARQLKELCPKFLQFSLALDESTDISDNAQLCIFIKGTTEKLETHVELLDIVSLVATTTGEDIFEKVEELIENFCLDWANLESVSTDGAAAMTGLIKGLKGRILAKLRALGLPEIPFIHCWIHQETLCAKSLDQANETLKVIVKTINLIRARALNHRQFKLLIQDFDLECGDVLYYSAVMWLSCGKSVTRFVTCKEPIQLFIREKGIDIPQLLDESWWTEVAFYSDIYTHLNNLNLSLQGQNKLITDLRDKIKAFKLKLLLYKMHLSMNNLDNFPNLKMFCSELSSQLSKKFAQCLSDLHDEFNSRFADLDIMSDKFLLFTSPFTVDPLSTELPFPAEELIDLQCNASLDDAQKRLPILDFWEKVASTKQYPGLCKFAAGICCMFGTTYDCECTFSLMKYVKNKYRGRLSDKHLSHVLRVMTAKKLKADIPGIVRKRKQFHFAKSTATDQ